MAGLLVLGILVLWVFLSFCGVWFLLKNVKPMFLRIIANGVLSVLLFLAPIADEIIGGFQFRSICKGKHNFYFDEVGSIGKEVLFSSVNTPLSVYSIPITRQSWVYRDVKTKKILISWNIYKAKGGWLSRKLPIMEGSPPLSFYGYCAPSESKGFDFDRYKIKKVKGI